MASGGEMPGASIVRRRRHIERGRPGLGPPYLAENVRHSRFVVLIKKIKTDYLSLLADFRCWLKIPIIPIYF